MVNPLVSVIIPTFNRAECLTNAVQSVINQDYRPLDVIIIDDGSTDDTRNAVQKFIGNNNGLSVRYFYQKNGGVSAARNYGIELAKGKYVSFCDSDDILLPGKIRNQIALMVHKGAQVSYGKVRYNSEKRVYLNHPKPVKDDPVLQFLKFENVTPNHSWMFAKELFKCPDLRFRVGCSWAEDNEFLVKALFLSKKTVYFDFCTADITLGRDDGLSKFSWDKAGKEVYIYEQIRSWLEEHSTTEAKRKKYRNTINHYTIPAQIISKVWARRADKKSAKEVMEAYPVYTSAMNSLWGLIDGVSIAKIKMLIKIILLRLYLR